MSALLFLTIDQQTNDDYKNFITELSESQCGYSESLIKKDTVKEWSKRKQANEHIEVWRLIVWSGDLCFNEYSADKHRLIEMARLYFLENSCNIAPPMIYLNANECLYKRGDTLRYKNEFNFIVGAANPFGKCCCMYSPVENTKQSYSEKALTKIKKQ